MRPMPQQEVDETAAKGCQALLDGAGKVVRAQIFVGHFGGEEDLASRNPRRAHAFADTTFGTVFPCGIDETIAERERGRDDLGAVAERGGTETDRRDYGPMRGQGRSGRGSHRADARAGERRKMPPALSLRRRLRSITAQRQAGFVVAKRQAGIRASSSLGSRST